jgi:soluble lytic murein transglycosylase-like protein
MPTIRDQPVIPLFDRTPHHSSVPTEVRAAGARSGGPGRPSGRRFSALPWMAASTLAGWPSVGRAVRSIAIIAVLNVVVASPAVAQTAPAASPSVASVPSDPFAAFIDGAARRFGVPALWVHFVMQAESAGNARVVSSKGAIGLMQIMPDTYARLRQSYGLGADPFQPRDNIMAGAAYLREMYDRYGSAGFLAAYNAGPGRYEDHLATGRPLPEETRLYLARLAPLIASVQAERIATAPDPLAWTRAPLFVGRAIADGKPVSTVAERSLNDAAVADVTALEPRSDGLFVPTHSGDRPR